MFVCLSLFELTLHCRIAHRFTISPQGNNNFVCTEHPNCKSGGMVVTCLYDGGHTTPGGSVAEDITWWFVDQVSKSGRGNATQLQPIASEG